MNEMLVAYQLNIPIVVITGTGGWADEMAGKYFDSRKRIKAVPAKIAKCVWTLPNPLDISQNFSIINNRFRSLKNSGKTAHKEVGEMIEIITKWFEKWEMRLYLTAIIIFFIGAVVGFMFILMGLKTAMAKEAVKETEIIVIVGGWSRTGTVEEIDRQ
ncbi:MAG: hypothetical protein AABX29_06900, partial [Nanoarchaeota archaeon]